MSGTSVASPNILPSGTSAHITTFESTTVCIRTDSGVERRGESTPFGPNYIQSHALGVRVEIAKLADMLIGCEPRKVDRFNEFMDSGLLGHLHAKAAINVACWDVFGETVGICKRLFTGLE